MLALCNSLKSQEYNPHQHKGLKLTEVTVLSPPSCIPNSNIDMLYIVHTSPDHSEKRSILRMSWTSNRISFNKTKTIFVIGKSNDAIEARIKREYDEFNDIFMYNLDDTYRNMTIKVDIHYKIGRLIRGKTNEVIPK